MMKRISLLTLFLVCLVTLLGAETQIRNLKTEYSTTPLGIDVEKPRFSWQMHSEENGMKQQGYQIVVTDEAGQIVWDSGRVGSDVSLNIRYDGMPLKPATRYDWKLAVWDRKNKQHKAASWFETGLMNPTLAAWHNAKWIGGSDEDMVFYAHYLPVFRMEYSLQLDEATKSTRAGFVYGANDARLMDKNMNIFHLENAPDTSYCMLEIDIAPLSSGAEALLHIYRRGYHPDDKKEEPFRSFPIPLSLIHDQNKYEKHRIRLTSNLGHTQVAINDTTVASLGMNPINQGGDYIAFPVVGDIGYCVPPHQTATFSDIEIRHFRRPSAVIAQGRNETVAGGEEGSFKTYDPSRNAMSMLRTTFATGQPVKKARLYVTARGIYEFYINGKRVGDDFFNPEMTQYNKTHMYQTFDVTAFVQSGKNAMGAILGEGWWSGGATYTGDNWNFFGDRQSLLAKLVVTYADGKEDIIVSNPDDWQCFNDGPVVYGSFFQGEVYDASKEKQIKGWNSASYDASGWKKAVVVPLAGTIAFPEERYAGMQLIGQYGQTVKAIKELTAQSVEEVRPGVFVYDMGQNMVGVPRIHLSGQKAGQKINLRFAEVKYPDLPEYKELVGMLMLENIRAAMAQDIYYTKGGEETIQPRFTFHGYRFLEITGIDRPLPLEAVKGVVISSVHNLASSYETSNEQVNKLWENITWSTYGNFLSIPTDCPQRNERMGWSGDISVFARAASYLADAPQFLRRHMLAMRDSQRENGRFPDVAPMDVGFGGLLWGSAGITVAWEAYQQYQDEDLLAEHYDAMKRYIHFLQDEMMDKESGLIVQTRAWGDLGDWLGPEERRDDKSLLWEAYFIYDLDIMQRVATVLGKTADASRFATLLAERKAFFNATYIHPATGKTIFSAFDEKRKGEWVDTQTSYILPLVFDLVEGEAKNKLTARFIETMRRENKADNGVICPPYSLMTGFIGTTWVAKALSDNGHTADAYRLLQQTSYPSWLYPVEQGATTIWERLNSYTHTHGFGGNNSMNSFNHYSFGAVASWMYNYSLGIERDENEPGFKHFLLKPEPDPTGEMTFAKGHYDSMYGRIESAWKKEGNVCTYSFVVPANTTATLSLQATSEKNIKSGKKAFKKMKGVLYKGSENGRYLFELEPGSYHLQCDF
ncbi:alpha-L-rhamnosidase [Parabacteroides sp. PFB2-10]|nr:alpha-L-rhamnosidase [Parabacteroides sp. PFB2-10]